MIEDNVLSFFPQMSSEKCILIHGVFFSNAQNTFKIFLKSAGLGLLIMIINLHFYL